MGNSGSQVSSYVAADYYPAPYGGWVGDWADSYARARELVESMTLAEKTNITSGTGIYMGMNLTILVIHVASNELSSRVRARDEVITEGFY